MDLNIKEIEQCGYSINSNFAKDVYVIENFLPKKLCRSVVKNAHNLMKELPHRKVTDGIFYSFDVLPQNTQTNRIFRTIQFEKFTEKLSNSEIITMFELMIDFQNKFIIKSLDVNGEYLRKCQIIHYPRGGGFFDWHKHPQYPVNYGLILNLSERKNNFDVGATEILSTDGTKICVENFCDIGDLILFKYDLKHRVSPCNPYDDLTFDINGRWTAILPID